ncbi:MAG TPA: ATP-binding protein [Ignavibacteriaceae bacterium]|nr:ATP-binding protein [Ignavibacteriaceae bacterium]
MKKKELLKLIEDGENLKCEFKLKFSSHDKIAKEIIALANTKGGFLLMGIDDNKNVVGVESEKAETELVTEAALNYCEPPVNITITTLELYGKDIVLASIPESNSKPHRIQDYEKFDIVTAQVYIRVNDKSMLASKEMIRILKANTDSSLLKKYSLGNVEKLAFDLLTKKETLSVNELCQAANISHRRASRSLVNMVRAGLLLIHTKDNGEEFFTSAV